MSSVSSGCCSSFTDRCSALGLGLLPVVTGALAGVAAVALGFGVVHGLTLGFGTTLIGEAVDYSIYFLVQSSPATSQATADRGRWIVAFWPTIRLGMLTSVVGFCTLLFSGFPGLAQLGLYSVSGIVVAAAVTRYRAAGAACRLISASAICRSSAMRSRR